MAKYNWMGRTNNRASDALRRAGVEVVSSKGGTVLRIGPDFSGHGNKLTPPSAAATRQELIAELEAQQKARKGKPQ